MNAPFAALRRPLCAVPAGAQALAVGYSGGIDSTSLLHALTCWLPDTPLRAIHVCHHLQPAAERWAQQCRDQCLAWGVGFTRLDVNVDRTQHGMEAAARAARYRAVRDALQRDEFFVTAHHRDDQAETFLLQALRGAGPRGLAAMPRTAIQATAGHWRPWLGVARVTIRDYAAHHRLHWVDDPSNHDGDRARSFIRTRVMPAIQTHWPAASATLSRAAAHAQEAACAIDALAAIDLDAVRDDHARLSCSGLAALSRPRARQVVRRWLAQAGHDTPDHRHLAGIMSLLQSRLAASPCVHFGATDVRRFDAHLYCMPALAAAPNDDTQSWDPREPLTLPGHCGELRMARAPAAALPLAVGFRRGGERLLQPDHSHRRLKDVLREAGVPPWVRARVPLIQCRDQLILVPGVWRHPRLERIVGRPIGCIVWRHRLIDGRPRVVRDPAFG